METPLKITFKDIKHSDAIEQSINDRLAKLERLFPRITDCRVVVESPHRHQHKGNQYQLRIALNIPGHEVIVNREPEHDVYVAVKSAFQAAEKQLQHHAAKMRGQVKTHEEPPHGTIVKLFAGEGYGFISTSDEREIYFHENSVLEKRFEDLTVGDSVRFVEDMGDQGPQASTVRPLS